jgi:hypothetical protein
VFAFVAAHEFARSDFPQSGYNVHRLSRNVTQLLCIVRRYTRHVALDASPVDDIVTFDPFLRSPRGYIDATASVVPKPCRPL